MKSKEEAKEWSLNGCRLHRKKGVKDSNLDILFSNFKYWNMCLSTS